MKKLLALMLVLVTALGAVAQERTRTVYAISPNMNCQNCANRVINALGAVQGIDSVIPDLATQTVAVVYDAKTLKPEIIVNALTEIGYTLTPAAEVAKVSSKVTQAAAAASTTAAAADANAAAATTATEAAPATVVPQGAEAEKFQQVENGNPGIVTVIDGKPVQQGTAAGHQCTGQCGRQQQCRQGGQQTAAQPKAKKAKKAKKGGK